VYYLDGGVFLEKLVYTFVSKAKKMDTNKMFHMKKSCKDSLTNTQRVSLTINRILFSGQVNIPGQDPLSYQSQAIYSRQYLILLNLLCALLVSVPAAFSQKLLDASGSGGPISIVAASSGGSNTSVSAAYSVRQLKTTYDHTAITPPSAVSGFTNSSTPLLRVRRSIDNASLDMGYDGSGNLDTVTLKNFVSDNGASPTASGYVSAWYDQSGNSKDMSQTILVEQPRIVNAGILDVNNNGVPGMIGYDPGDGSRFGTLSDGGNGLADASNRYGISGDRTLNVVTQVRAYSNAGAAQDGLGSYVMDRAGTGSAIPLTSIKIVNNKWAIQIRNDAGTISSSYTGNIALSTGRADNLTVIRSGDDYPFYVNGVQAGTATLSGANNMFALRVGYGGASGSAENIYFGECILFPSALSTTNLAVLTSSQNTYFKLGYGNKLLDAANNGGLLLAVTASSGGANSSVSLAYSIRQLKTTYDHTAITAPGAVSGFINAYTPLLRVRRSSDNGELDIGYDDNGNLDSVTLKNFVSNNGANPTANGFISVWYDLSGNSKDAIQTTTASQPRIVNAGVLDVSASGVPGIMVISGSTINEGGTATNSPDGANRYGITGNRTLNVVCQARAYTNASHIGGGGTYVLDRNGGTGQDVPLTSLKTSSDKWALQIRNDAGTITSSFEGSIEVSTTRADNLMVIRTGDTYALEVNGVSAGTSTLSGVNSMAPLRIGYGASSSETVYFGEALLFGSALSTADRSAINSSQSAYYSLGTGQVWTGATSSDWTITSNWSNSTIPTAASNVTIPAGTTNALNITSGQTTLVARKLTINSSATVTIDGNLNVSDSITVNGIITGTGTLTANGGLKQYIRGTINNLINSNVTETIYATGNVTVNGALTISSSTTLDLSTYTLGGTLTTISNSGTITTSSTSGSALPTGKTWGGTVQYAVTTGGQTVSDGTYNNLTLSNTSGTQSLGGTTTISAALTMAGGKLARGANTLNINGSISGLTASGSFVSSGSSNISIGGSGALGNDLYLDQTTPGTTNRLNNFTYNRSSQTITLGNALQVTGTLTPTAGALATGDVLTLVSDASNTARIPAGSGSYITGNVTAERYIPSVARRWRFMASPITGTTLADWQNEIYITGTGGASNGFDATTSNQAGVYTYDETLAGDFNANGWTAATNTSNALSTGKGFRVFIRGDRSDPGVLNGNTGTQTAVTMNAVGAVNTGDITMPVTYTNSGNNAHDGWNMVGNPYPSAIDWNAFHDAGRTGSSPDYSGTDYAHLDAVISTYDANTASYASYNAASNIGTGSLSSGIIPSGGAFWVKASAASPSMTMKEVYKTSATPAAIFKTSPEQIFTLRFIKDAITSDEMLVKYIAEADRNFDSYDIAELISEVNVSSITENGTLLSANCKPFNGIGDTIMLDVTVTGNKSGNYSFEAKNMKLLSATQGIYLVDGFAHQVIDLNVNSSYTFAIDKDNVSSFGSHRFMIVVGDVKPTTTGVEEISLPTNLSVFPTVTHGQITISTSNTHHEKASVIIADITGRQMASYHNLQWNDQQINLDLSEYKTGAYFISIITDSKTTVVKCIKE
jgi:hypothetical protein